MKKTVILIMIFMLSSMLPSQKLGDLLNKARNAKKTADKVTKVAEAVRPLNEEEEYYVGRSVAAMILARYPLWKNDRFTSYLNLVGNALAIHSLRPEVYSGYHFAVLDTTEINAFAAPSGIVFLTRGLIRACETEDQLAAVVAHEISHVVAKHPLSAIRSSRLQGLAAMGVEELARGNTQVVGIFKDSVMDIAGTLLTKGYSRSQEKDADLDALFLLADSGYNPRALLEILEKFQDNEVKKSKIYSAHPPAVERCRYVRKKTGKGSPEPGESVRNKRFQSVKKTSGV